MQSAASSALRLPCGLVLRNRLVKSGMSEKMAVGGQPTADLQRVYVRWAKCGWGALITGNIMVDDRYLGDPADVTPSGSDSAVIERWTVWTSGVRGQGCPMIAQLNHPGRQSPVGAGNRSFFAKTLAPSAVPLNLGDNWLATAARVVVFGTPQAMTYSQIEDAIAQFSRAAAIAYRAGFDGVEVHAAHGFLLSQFMSLSSNKRSDEFGGSAENRVEIVLRVIRAIRREVPPSFCVGVKINTADYMNKQGFEDMMRQIELIHAEKVDYIQLSGGSFEDPQMLSTNNSGLGKKAPSERTIAREGFFLQSSREIRRRFPNLVLIVTGGFRSRQGINSALEGDACDAIGLGRPAVKYPGLPNEIMFNKDVSDKEARFDVETAPSPGWIGTKIRSIGAGAETVSSSAF